jgi:hypothetical protein
MLAVLEIIGTTIQLHYPLRWVIASYIWWTERGYRVDLKGFQIGKIYVKIKADSYEQKRTAEV